VLFIIHVYRFVYIHFLNHVTPGKLLICLSKRKMNWMLFFVCFCCFCSLCVYGRFRNNKEVEIVLRSSLLLVYFECGNHQKSKFCIVASKRLQSWATIFCFFNWRNFWWLLILLSLVQFYAPFWWQCFQKSLSNWKMNQPKTFSMPFILCFSRLVFCIFHPM
jgi:hypothetical protein